MLYPWRNTSEEISTVSGSQWETPQGAQKKADKAEDNAKKYADEHFAKNAFSIVKSTSQPDIKASGKEDTLNIEGGTGIKVTHDPDKNELRITATSEAIPGAHGESHDVHGADPIPDLVEHLNEHYYLQEDEPVDTNKNTLWFEVDGEVNFNKGGVFVGNAVVSYTPPETTLWFEIL